MSKTAEDNAIRGPLGVIDVGAHTIRLQIAQVLPEGGVQILEDLAQPIALGRDVFTRGRIPGAKISRAGRILTDFAEKLAEYQVENYKAVATSAVREAANRDLFVSRIRNISGISLEILEDMQEIRLMYLAVRGAVRHALDLRKHQVLLCNIGTGSSQVAFLDSGRLTSGESIRLGTLRVMEELGGTAAGPEHVREIVDPFVSIIINWVGRITVPTRSDSFVALGSSVRAIACIGSGAPNNQEIVYLSRDDFRGVTALIDELSPDEAARKWRLSDTDAASLQPCAAMLEHMFEITEADRLLVPMTNTREALIHDIIRERRGESDPFVPEIISCAETIGEKFHYDSAHARCVADNALALFDKLRDLHHLGGRARVLLEVAAVLHEIGLFISNEAHHKHSRYLVMNSHLPGLSTGELMLVAVICRYHRKASPRPQHREYMSLSPDNRLLVYKLAAILRVADALDRSHAGTRPQLRLTLAEDRLLIRARVTRELSLER
ncbi:MAG: HD domain-containing protein, partial [bacterium]